MKYYVYHLIDPRTALPFYVGKGKGNRIEAHERQARLSGSRLVTSAKCNRIREIWAAGLRVVHWRVRFFTSEQESLRFELEQIQALPGLTNIHLHLGSRSEARARRRRALRRQRHCSQRQKRPVPFTESLIARIAWIVVKSQGLQHEFTIEHPHSSSVAQALSATLNGFGYVRAARMALSAWVKQRGREAVCARFRPYGIEMAFSENTEKN